MNIYIGIIEIRLQNIGSKSEGNYVYLLSEDFEYELFRKGASNCNDDYFTEFNNKNVIVEGEAVREKWIAIHSITLIIENTDNNENNSISED